MYLATVIDSYTKEILGFSLSIYHTSNLVCNALSMAINTRRKPIIFHSDQESENGAQNTVDELDKLNFQRSMSRAGTPTDNPISERFVRTFKLAVTKRYRYKPVDEFVVFATKWLNFYNELRPHHSLRQKSSNQYAKESELNKVEFLYLKLV